MRLPSFGVVKICEIGNVNAADWAPFECITAFVPTCLMVAQAPFEVACARRALHRYPSRLAAYAARTSG